MSALDPEDFGRAVRALLAAPIVQRSDKPDSFRLVAIQYRPLREWFESNLGWRLHVDLPGGVARLHKRSVEPDPRRGLHRTRGKKRAFDSLRYQILCLACTGLLRRPHQTMGDLADLLEQTTASDEALTNFDPTRHAHRLAFVDVMIWLEDQGIIKATAGRLDTFSSAERKDAVIKAQTQLIPMLLSCETPPSRVADLGQTKTPKEWAIALSQEGLDLQLAQEPHAFDQSQKNKRARQRILRLLLDDPVMDLRDLSAAEKHYLQSPSGRDKVMKVLAEAGFVCERHNEIWLAVDPSLESSDVPEIFSQRPSVVEQVAGLLLLSLLVVDKRGTRVGVPRTIESLEADLSAHMKRNPNWGKGARKSGVAVNCKEALDLLAEFGLVAIRDGQAHPRPAAARYCVQLQSSSS